MEEFKRRRKVSPIIARRILFIEEKSKINTHELELGTAQQNFLRSSDLAALAELISAMNRMCY